MPDTLIKDRSRPVGNWQEMLTVQENEKGMLDIDLQYFEHNEGETDPHAPGELVARTFACLPLSVAKEIAAAVIERTSSHTGAMPTG